MLLNAKIAHIQLIKNLYKAISSHIKNSEKVNELMEQLSQSIECLQQYLKLLIVKYM